MQNQAYAELRDDQNATGQAVAVLFLASLSLAFGYAIWNLNYQSKPLAADSILIGTFTYLLESLLANLVWVFALFLVGTKLFKGKARFWEVARPNFFSRTPAIFFLVLTIPVFALYASATIAIVVWLVIGSVMALKNSMGFNYFSSVLVHLVAFLALAFVGLPFGTI